MEYTYWTDRDQTLLLQVDAQTGEIIAATRADPTSLTERPFEDWSFEWIRGRDGDESRLVAANEAAELEGFVELPADDITCPTCGADIGPSSDYPWHLEDEDCRAVRDPIDE